VHNPEVLILDEPTAGVDIELRQSLWEYAKKLNKQGTTIVLTTHYLEEAEQLCDEIAIINHGKIVAHDKKKTLLKKLNNKRIVIHTQKNPEKVPPSLKSYNPVMPDDNTVEIRYNPEEIEICDILKDIHDSGLKITDLVTQDTKLEDIFLQLTKAA